MKRFFSLLLICTLCCSIFAGCNNSFSKNNNLKIVCTLFPQYDFCRQIVGDNASVTLLLPPGSESHSYEPTPSDIISIGECDVFIYIGDEMETWASSVMSDINPEKTTVIDISDELCLDIASHAHHDHDENESQTDPHIWTSVKTSLDIVELIRDVLMEKDPVKADSYAENAGILLSEYTNLDLRIRDTVKNSKRTEIVFAGRFALRNFAEEYGLKYITAFDSCTEESEPSAARIAELIDTVNDKKLPVIFCEELKEPKAAQTVSDETGAVIRCFHSCHNLSAEDFENGETYQSIMERNLTYLAEALN